MGILHGTGRVVICYFSAGTIEEGRPDFADFPASAIGMTLSDWPAERWEAHARGLSVGLKNDLDQVTALVADFDWALDEECFRYSECGTLQPFIDAGKAVFQVEYGDMALATTVCPQANALDFDTLIKNLDLDAWRIACR